MNINIVNKSDNALPRYQTEGAAGMDIRSFLETPVTLKPLERRLIPTGLYLELPLGYEAQVRPRSGMAYKHGITVLNSPGTIDADYRGEVGVLLVNLSDQPFTIESGDRIAQLVIAKHEQPQVNEVVSLNETTRASGGFGSTGTK